MYGLFGPFNSQPAFASIDEFGPLHLLPRHGHCRKGPGQHVYRIRANYERTKDIRHFLAYYDLETDRGESKNLAGQNPKIATRLAEAALRWRKSQP